MVFGIILYTAVTLYVCYIILFPKCKVCQRRFKSFHRRTEVCPDCVKKRYDDFLAERQRKEREEELKRKERLEQAPSIQLTERVIPFEYMGHRRTYAYDDVKLYIVPGEEPEFEKLDPGDDLSIYAEPQNSYDSNAIFFKTWNTSRAGSVKVGYIRKGKLQDMIHDYNRRNCPIIAFIKSIDDDNGIITISLAFYGKLIDLE